MLDLDESDEITGQELGKFAAVLAHRQGVKDLSHSQLRRIYAKVDADHDGAINLIEFTKGLAEVNGLVKNVFRQEQEMKRRMEAEDRCV